MNKFLKRVAQIKINEIQYLPFQLGCYHATIWRGKKEYYY